MQEKHFECPQCKHFTEKTAFERPCPDCEQTFNLMDEFGACPKCQLVHSVHTCPECGMISNLAEWWTRTSDRSLFRLFNGLAKVREAAGKTLRVNKRKRQYVVDPGSAAASGRLAADTLASGRKRKFLSITACWRNQGHRMERNFILKPTPALQESLFEYHPQEKDFLSNTVEWHMSSFEMKNLVGDMKRTLSIIRRIKRINADERIITWSSSPTDTEELVKVLRQIRSLRHFDEADFYLSYQQYRLGVNSDHGREKDGPSTAEEQAVHFEVTGNPANRKKLQSLMEGDMMARLGYSMLFDFYRHLASLQEHNVKLLLTSTLTGNRNLALIPFSKSDFGRYVPLLLTWFEQQEEYEKCQMILRLLIIFEQHEPSE